MRHIQKLTILLAMLSAGCQCCQLTEKVADVTDAISAHQCAADGMYCAGLDLTRIGRRDWCQYRINSWLCPCRCELNAPETVCR